MQRLNGSSSVSETYGNPCLAHTEDFEVKEVEVCMEPLPFSLSLSHTHTHIHEASHFLWFISSTVSNSFWDGYKITDRSRIFSFHIAVVGLCIWFKVWGNTCFKQNWVSWDLSVLNVQEWDRAHSLWRGSSGLFDTTEWCWMPIHCTSQMEVGTCKESFTINLCTQMFNL
jgi:hypothetical protein